MNKQDQPMNQTYKSLPPKQNIPTCKPYIKTTLGLSNISLRSKTTGDLVEKPSDMGKSYKLKIFGAESFELLQNGFN